MPTRWPTLGDATPAPTASTMPTISCPGTTGRRMPGSSPSTMCRSVRQTPQASTLTRTSPGPGSGSGRSSSTRGRPREERTIARKARLRATHRSANQTAIAPARGQRPRGRRKCRGTRRSGRLDGDLLDLRRRLGRLGDLERQNTLGEGRGDSVAIGVGRQGKGAREAAVAPLGIVRLVVGFLDLLLTRDGKHVI